MTRLLKFNFNEEYSALPQMSADMLRSMNLEMAPSGGWEMQWLPEAVVPVRAISDPNWVVPPGRLNWISGIEIDQAIDQELERLFQGESHLNENQLSLIHDIVKDHMKEKLRRPPKRGPNEEGEERLTCIDTGEDTFYPIARSAFVGSFGVVLLIATILITSAALPWLVLIVGSSAALLIQQLASMAEKLHIKEEKLVFAAVIGNTKPYTWNHDRANEEKYVGQYPDAYRIRWPTRDELLNALSGHLEEAEFDRGVAGLLDKNILKEYDSGELGIVF